MVQRRLARAALEHGGQQAGQRGKEALIVGIEGARRAPMHLEAAERAPAHRHRHGQHRAESGLCRGTLQRSRRDDLGHRHRLRQHRAEVARQPCVGIEHVQHAGLGVERVGGGEGGFGQQRVRVEAVDRQAAHLRDALGMAGAPQRLLDARVLAHAADRGQHKVPVVGIERAECDLDQHMAAVATSRGEVQLRAHRAHAWRALEAFAVRRMATARRVGHQGLDGQTAQLLDRITEQRDCRLVGAHDAPPTIDQQHAIGVGVEHRAPQSGALGRHDGSAGTAST